MSTNFYMSLTCGACGHEQKVHLGLSSIGWTFTFQADKEQGVVDYNTWLVRIRALRNAGWSVENEYGEKINLDDFLGMVNGKKDEKRTHAREYPSNDDWVDKDGNSFSDREFS